ncbi:MAG: hypothetical protein LBU85_00615 [Treponema sp.]|jgi:hypothetical protein|nr:hypothetical protein [Treponema sp.]
MNMFSPCARSLFAIFAAIIASLAACKEPGISSIKREDLFSLEIGPMEDQIGLYLFEGDSGSIRTDFAMRDGQFYIADGNSGKIVRYNSYGDILFMIYNEETNPAPFSLETNIGESGQVTRWAFAYPLREPGRITVDSRKHIYAEDRFPRQNYRFDEESRTLLDGIILHFDQDGRFIRYLGQDGIGGSPFPRIVGLHTSVRDELAVICRIPDGWNVYWYSASGALLFLVKINNGAIPSQPDWPAALASVDSIAAAPDSRRLFLKVDYYRDTFDQSTSTRTGSEPANSAIWTLDVEDGSYSGPFEVPLFELPESGREAHVRMFYSMLGVIRNGKVFLYFPVDSGYSILVLDTHSREQRRGYINFTNEELRFNDFYLSADGILSAMLADDRVKLVSWRTDILLGEGQ